METLKKIVCPVNFSNISKICIQKALKIAAISKGKIAIMHMILDPWSDMYYQRADTAKRGPAAAEKRAKEILKKFAEECALDVEFDFYVECVLDGRPGRGIAKFARFYNADLIVMPHGNEPGRSKEDELISSVVRWTHCSVLSLRPNIMISDNVLNDKLVLLVDDEPDVIESLSGLLDMCRLHTALNHDAAVELIEKNKYDVVVLDIMGVNGFDLLERCVKSGVPAIMLTAHVITAEAVKKSMKLGAVFFLPKEGMFELPDFMEKIVLGGGNPVWNGLFERLDFYLEKRMGKDWEAIKRQVNELEKNI